MASGWIFLRLWQTERNHYHRWAGWSYKLTQLWRENTSVVFNHVYWSSPSPPPPLRKENNKFRQQKRSCLKSSVMNWILTQLGLWVRVQDGTNDPWKRTFLFWSAGHPFLSFEIHHGGHEINCSSFKKYIFCYFLFILALKFWSGMDPDPWTGSIFLKNLDPYIDQEMTVDSIWHNLITTCSVPDLYVFGPPGLGPRSVIYLYGSGSGSGSFHQQAKKLRETLISTVSWLLYDLLSFWEWFKCTFKKE